MNWLNDQLKKLKALINKLSMRLSRLKFKSDNTLKSKAAKYFLKKILPDYK